MADGRANASQIATPTIQEREQMRNVENVEDFSNLSSMRSSGVLPVIPITIVWRNALKTIALCDAGASLSFVDESLMKEPALFIVAGFMERQVLVANNFESKLVIKTDKSIKTPPPIVIPKSMQEIERTTSRC